MVSLKVIQEIFKIIISFQTQFQDVLFIDQRTSRSGLSIFNQEH